jgi:alanyl-tRNA synthetase
VKVIDGRNVVLKETAFYPEGGGQPGDHGQIQSPSGTAKIVDVQKVGNVIVHVTEGTGPREGARVKGTVDWYRRSNLMRHHSGTHILIGAVRRVLGEHAWQAGAQKGVESSRIDVSHYDRITPEQVEEIERLATETVLANVPIEASWMPRERAEQMFGFRIYQGGVVPGKEARIIKIGDWDVEACGGTHCKSTGEVGIIKVLRTERIQDGVERIIFVAGTQALREFQDRDGILTRISDAVNAPVEKTAEYVATLIAEKSDTERRLRELVEKQAAAEAQMLLNAPTRIGPVILVTVRKTGDQENELIAISNQVTQTTPNAVFVGVLSNRSARLFVGSGKAAQQAGVHAGQVAKELAKHVGGGGGGEAYFAQAGGPRVEGAQDIIRDAPKVIERYVRK